MEITNTIHDIIMGQVDNRLKPARVFADKKKEALEHAEVVLRNALRGKMCELAKEADRQFRAWVAKQKGGKGIKVRAYYNDDTEASVFDFSSPDRFKLPFDSRQPDEAFSAFRREVLQRALRIASENPPRTAYTAVDAYLAGIDPVAALKKRLTEGGGK